MKKNLIFSTALIMCALIFVSLMSSCEKEELEEPVAEGQLKSFQSSTHNGYYWQLWKSDGLSGSIDYKNGAGGNYSVSWNCSGNYTCGKGWSTGTNNRVIGYNCGSYSHNGGGGSFAVYGWTKNPLIEYYVQEKWPGSRPTSGINMGSITTDGATYDLRRDQRVNAPSIDGTKTFWQLKSTRRSQASTGKSNTVTFANHANGWANGGMSLGSNHSYQILLQEAWGTSNGYVNATVWSNGTSNGDSNNNDGGDDNGGSNGGCKLELRASSTDGNGKVKLIVGGNTVADWTLGSSMTTKTVTLYSSKGDCKVEYYNDGSGRDVRIDYLKVNGSTRQAEDQSYNTAAWGNGECGGGSYTEMMNCNGAMGFGNISY